MLFRLKPLPPLTDKMKEIPRYNSAISPCDRTHVIMWVTWAVLSLITATTSRIFLSMVRGGDIIHCHKAK